MLDYMFDLLFYQFPRYIYAQRNCKICCRFIVIIFCNTIISIENFVSYLTLQFFKLSTAKLKLNLHFFTNWIVQFIHHKISRTNSVLFTLEILQPHQTTLLFITKPVLKSVRGSRHIVFPIYKWKKRCSGYFH